MATGIAHSLRSRNWLLFCLQDGIGQIGELLNGVTRWMEEHEYDSIDTMKGSLSHRSTAEPAAFERANYMKVLASWK